MGEFELSFGSQSETAWEGEIFYASIYNRSLRPEEIEHHLGLGSGIDPENSIDMNSVLVEECERWPFDLIRVEDFNLFKAAGCRSVDGNVRIPPMLENLESLNALIEISGDLLIENTTLSTLTGLNSLGQVGGRVIIDKNTKLENLSALSDLKTIGNDFKITDNPLIESYDLPIESVSGNLSLKNLPNLISIDGLQELVSVGGLLTIDRMIGLTSVFLPKLESAQSISLSKFEVVEINMPLLNNVDSIWLRELPSLTTFTSPVVPRSFHIFKNDVLANLEGFHGNALTSVFIAYNSAMTRLSMDATALNRIIIVENNLSAIDLKMLTAVTEFDLTSSAAVNLDNALPELTSAGTVTLWNNDALLSITGAFPKLWTDSHRYLQRRYWACNFVEYDHPNISPPRFLSRRLCKQQNTQRLFGCS